MNREGGLSDLKVFPDSSFCHFQNFPEEMFGTVMGGIDFKCAFTILDGLWMLIVEQKDETPLEVCFSRPGVEQDGFGEVLDGQQIHLFFVISHAPVEVGRSISGLKPNGSGEIPDGQVGPRGGVRGAPQVEAH